MNASKLLPSLLIFAAAAYAQGVVLESAHSQNLTADCAQIAAFGNDVYAVGPGTLADGTPFCFGFSIPVFDNGPFAGDTLNDMEQAYYNLITASNTIFPKIEGAWTASATDELHLKAGIPASEAANWADTFETVVIAFNTVPAGGVCNASLACGDYPYYMSVNEFAVTVNYLPPL